MSSQSRAIAITDALAAFACADRPVIVQRKSLVVTDAMYNLSRDWGESARGIDVVDRSTGCRYYIAPDTNRQAETEIRASLGAGSILARIATADNQAIYEVERGARRLTHVLEDVPYVPPHRQLMEEAATELIRGLTRLRHDAFGIELGQLAYIEEDLTGGTRDSSFSVTVIPPLAAESAPGGRT